MWYPMFMEQMFRMDSGPFSAAGPELAAARTVFLCSESPVSSPKPGVAAWYYLAQVKTVQGDRHVVAVSSLVDMGNNMAAAAATQEEFAPHIIPAPRAPASPRES